MIGVFDSGIGGLSILRSLRAELPGEDFIYVADSGHAPYGERDNAHVIARARALTAYLYAQDIKVLVVACNTATAAAIELLRVEYPLLPIVGVEPAIKPAVAISKTRRIGVMATRCTLGSAKFQALLQTYAAGAEFVLQPCDGLAHAIECSIATQDTTKIVALCEEYTRAMGQFGLENGQIDTLVLGCTHYSFVRPQLHDLLGAKVTLIDTGEPVARQTHRLLATPCTGAMGLVQLQTTGDSSALKVATKRWLGMDREVTVLAV